MKHCTISRTRYLMLTFAFFTATSVFSDVEYVVRHNDTLQIVALQFYGKSSRWPEIAKYNGLSEPYRIYAGQKLRLASESQVKSDTAEKLVVHYWWQVLGHRKYAQDSDSNDRSTTSEPETRIEPTGVLGTAPPTAPAPVTIPAPQDVVATQPGSPPRDLSRYSGNHSQVNLGVGFFADSLTQTSISPTNFSGIEVDASGIYFLKDTNYFAEARVDYGFLSLHKSNPAITTLSVFDGELRLGRKFSANEGALSFLPYLGVIYSNMFVTGDEFGYQNAVESGLGLNVGQVVTREIAIFGGLAYHFAKQIFTFGNRQIDARLAAQYRWSASNGIELWGTYSDFSLSETSIGSKVTLSTFKIGLSYLMAFETF